MSSLGGKLVTMHMHGHLQLQLARCSPVEHSSVLPTRPQLRHSTGSIYRTSKCACWHLKQHREQRRSCIVAARQNRNADSAAAVAAAVQQACNFDELQRLIELMPERFQESLQQQPHLHELIEVILDLGRTPVARFPQSYVALSDDKVSEEDIETAVSKVIFDEIPFAVPPMQRWRH